MRRLEREKDEKKKIESKVNRFVVPLNNSSATRELALKGRRGSNNDTNAENRAEKGEKKRSEDRQVGGGVVAMQGVELAQKRPHPRHSN